MNICKTKLTFVFILTTVIYIFLFQLYTGGLIPVLIRRLTPSILMKYNKNLAKFQGTIKENEKRRSHLTATCKDIKEIKYEPFYTKPFERNFIVDPRLKLGYCAIEKVASSFIRQIFNKLRTRGLDGSRLFTLNDFRNKSGFSNQVLNTSEFEKIIFVREPYGRLLSAYVDKLFAPNVVFWIYGRKMLSNLRAIDGRSGKVCGHDVTFPEYVEFIAFAIETGYLLDSHFAPLHKHCKPCRVSYDFIGKIETFEKDILYLLNSWNTKYDINIKHDDIALESDIYIITTNVKRLFMMKKKLLSSKCMSFHEALWRTWRVLQIRGILPIEVDLPFTKEESNNLTDVDFFSAAKQTLLSITNRTLVKQQRHDSFIEAFDLLSLETKERLYKSLEVDCKLFGYNPRPPNVFVIKPESKRNIKYFKLPW